MPDSTLNRRSVALCAANPIKLSYPQKTAESLKKSKRLLATALQALPDFPGDMRRI